jgi:hypothetical protein
LLEPLGALFPHYEVDARAHAAGEAVRLAVDASGGGFVVIDPLGARTECATLTRLLATCEFSLTQVFLAGCGEFAQLHASGAIVGAGAVLALGRAGAGKSSLALSWHRMGYPALGDDVVLLDGSGRAHPFKRLFELDAQTFEQLGVDPAETCLWEPGSDDAWYDPRGGAGWGEPAPVSLMAVASYSVEAELTVKPLSRAAALNALVHSQLTSTRDRRDRLEALAYVAEHAQAFEVTFGSAAEAAAALAARAA